MSSIRKRDTRPELEMRAALRRIGLTGYRCYVRSLPGNPDVVFTRWRLALFVDGVWWHGHPDWFTLGKRGPYWDRKITGNMARDRRVDEELHRLGWATVRLWDVDILRDPDAAAASVQLTLLALGRNGESTG